MAEIKYAPDGAVFVATFKETLLDKLEELEPNYLDVVSKEAKTLSKKKRRKLVKDSGKPLKKFLTANECTDNLVHMLNNKATLEETIAFASEGKPEGWFDSVKNDILPLYLRKDITINLREFNDEGVIPMLKHMIDKDYTSFREIQKYDTHNNQLKQVSKLITMSERISTLENQVAQLSNFKDNQLLFNTLVVSQMEYQNDKVNKLENVVSVISKKDRLVEYQKYVNEISDTKAKIEYLLSVDLTKKEISNMLGIPYRTLMRRINEFGLAQ